MSAGVSDLQQECVDRHLSGQKLTTWWQHIKFETEVNIKISNRQRPSNLAYCTACILTMSFSLRSFSFIVRHVFSVIFKSDNCAGQVIPGIFFLIYHSYVSLELSVGALLFLNIIGFSRNISLQLALNLYSKFSYTSRRQYYLKLVSEFLCHHTFCSP